MSKTIKAVINQNLLKVWQRIQSSEWAVVYLAQFPNFVVPQDLIRGLSRSIPNVQIEAIPQSSITSSEFIKILIEELISSSNIGMTYPEAGYYLFQNGKIVDFSVEYTPQEVNIAGFTSIIDLFAFGIGQKSPNTISGFMKRITSYQRIISQFKTTHDHILKEQKLRQQFEDILRKLREQMAEKAKKEEYEKAKKAHESAQKEATKRNQNQVYVNSCEILGISESATLNGASKAYKTVAKKYHPDSSSGNEETMKMINHARDVVWQNNRW